MGYLLSDYSLSYFPDNGTGYHPLYQDTTNDITYELIGVNPKEMNGRSLISGFTQTYSICGALIKIKNRYTPMIISTTPSGCRVRNNSTQEIGSYKQVKYNGYGYYVCDNIPGLADNITAQRMSLRNIDKNYNSIDEAVLDFLNQLDKLPTPSKTIWLLPEPTTKNYTYFSEYNSLLYNGNGTAYYAKPTTSTEKWWALGAILCDTSGYYHPIVISLVRDYAKLLDTQLVVNDSNIIDFEYNGFTYYMNSTISNSILTQGSSTTINSETIYYYSGPYSCCEFILYDNSSEEKIIEMGKSLLAQYEFEGGKLKSVAGKISAIKDLDEKGNSRGKTFSRAHAKTVYTDYYKGKTLDQDLEEITEALLKLQDKSDITQTDIENIIKEKAWIYEYKEKISDEISLAANKLIYLSNSSIEDRSNLPEDSGGLIYTTDYYDTNSWLTYIQFYFSFETQKLYYRKTNAFEEDTELFTNPWNEVSNSSGNVDISTKMDKKNAIGTGSFSLNRKANSQVGDYSVTLNNINTASNNNTFAHGFDTVASGIGSHSEGFSTEASGNYSHAEGYYTIAAGEKQHVEGRFNVEDTENKYAHIIGGGTSSTPKNIHTVDWDGNVYYAGTITCKKVITEGGSSVDISKLIEYGNDITD